MSRKKKSIILIAVIIVVAVIIISVILSERSVAPSVDIYPVASETSTAGATVSSTAVNVTSTFVTASSSSSSSSSPRLSVSFNRFYQGPSFTLSYPQAWTILSVRPFSLTTFGGKYGPNGTLPAGGSEIDVVTTTAPGGFADIMATQLMGAEHIATSTVTVDGVACTRTQYQEPNAGYSTESVLLYCEQGTELWQVGMVERVGDPNASQHLADLQEVLSAIKFIP